MPKKVYLAGPVRGLTYGECTSWREYAIKELAKYDIIGVSPMRCKEYLDNGQALFETDENPLSCDKGIVTRDRNDVMQNCDIILVNFLGAKTISIGTAVEYGWADAKRKPIIRVMEKKGNLNEHAFTREMSGYKVETLEEGLYIARAILTP